MPPPSARPLPAKPPWYRRAWFQALWVVVVFGAAGAFLGSQVR